MLVKFVLLLSCYNQLLGSAVSELTPTVFPANILSQCGQHNPLDNDEQLLDSLQQVKQRIEAQSRNSSCQEIHNLFPSAPSGYYEITSTNCSIVQVYCDMEGTNCGGQGGWTRVVYVQAGPTSCPMGLNNFDSYCAGMSNLGQSWAECNGTLFSAPVAYSRVCGRARGYQIGRTNAFYSYNMNNSVTINDAYLSGLSITYGSAPRKHVWS